MVLDLPGGLFEQRDVRETPAGSSSSTSSTNIIAPIGSIMAWLKSLLHTPQALPTGWVECDGSVVSDVDSVYDGDTLPDLNGGEFIRGASTSGGTGGSDTMAHTHTTNVTIDNHNAIAINNHTALTLNTDQHNHSFSDSFTTAIESQSHVNRTTSDPSSACADDNHTHTGSVSGNTGNDTHGHTFNQNISNHSIGTNIDAHTENNPASNAASNDENRPSFYNVVWIIRIK